MRFDVIKTLFSSMDELRNWYLPCKHLQNINPALPCSTNNNYSTYHLALAASSRPTAGTRRVDYVERAATLEVTEADVYGTGVAMHNAYGIFYLDGSWSIRGAEAKKEAPA